MYKEIFIIIVEDTISNTEVHFFKGMSYQINDENFVMRVGAIGRYGDHTTKGSLTTHKSKVAMLFNSHDYDTMGCIDEFKIFFIGDLDKKIHIPSMEKSIDIASKWIEETYLGFKDRITINKEIICDSGKKIENVIFPGDKPSWLDELKADSFHRLFDEWMNHHKIESYTKEELIEELKKFFKESKYLAIINEIN